MALANPMMLVLIQELLIAYRVTNADAKKVQLALGFLVTLVCLFVS